MTTLLATPTADSHVPDRTHLRIFKLRNLAAVEGLSPGLDAATLRVVPDEAERKANSAHPGPTAGIESDVAGSVVMDFFSASMPWSSP